jgi:hypothetical protein
MRVPIRDDTGQHLGWAGNVIDLANEDPQVQVAPGQPGASSRVDDVVRQHACPECGAGKGELCGTSGLRVTRDLHMARWREADRARRGEHANPQRVTGAR